MKLKLKTMSIEIERGTNLEILYRLKVNNLPVDYAEPKILGIGEVITPEVVEKKDYVYPILGALDVACLIQADAYVEIDKENNDQKKALSLPLFSGFPLYAKLTRLTIYNPNKQTILIHSLNYTSNIFGITMNYPDQTGEMFNPDVPNFFLFMREGNFTGDVLGAHELYTYDIPPSQSIQVNVFYLSSKGSKICKTKVEYIEYHTGMP